jgi:hypothetical protein
VLSWPLGPDNLFLERTEILGPGAAWRTVVGAVALRDKRRWLRLEAPGASGFYRLVSR